MLTDIYIGRNFNGGEVIQLVLKSPSTGRWLPFKFVQMVMMHELAHNKQMNHSKHFWAVRNEFSTEMKALWEREYTGEGLWGRGIFLENGAFAREELDEGEALPEHLCGGGFRSRGRKRKLKPKITYKERKERKEQKIKAKFGSGMTVGADEETKAKLEKGKRPVGKPRVASSARGRELRAAAALARFEVKKEEEESKHNDEDLVTDSETEDEDKFIKPDPDDLVDSKGNRILDAKGRGMVKVCEEEGNDDEDAKLELLELQNMKKIDGHSSRLSRPPLPPHTMPDHPSNPPQQSKKRQIKILPPESKSEPPPKSEPTMRGKPPKGPEPDIQEGISKAKENQQSSSVPSCPVCSVENEPTALTCIVCSNVLQPEFVPGSWRCDSATCRENSYLNAGDVGLCGVCGTRKCSD